MTISVRIIDAFRNKCVPFDYLSLASHALEMFDNQVCVKLQADYEGYFHTYEVEDKTRVFFMEKVFGWMRDNPTEGTWSIVSHGTKIDEDTKSSSSKYNSTFGFVFSNPADAETFMRNFLIIEKLTAE